MMWAKHAQRLALGRYSEGGSTGQELLQGKELWLGQLRFKSQGGHSGGYEK